MTTSSNSATMLETKEQLVYKIKEWVKIDNEIRTLQKEQVKRKNDKKRISSELMEVMRANQIDCFDINDGQIMYSKKHVKKPITKKSLMTILSTYCNGDTTKATEMNDFILSNREDIVKESIVRKIHKEV